MAFFAQSIFRWPWILLFVLGSLALAEVSCDANGTTYDFIIVGGGTAGLAVASRISQGLPNACVLVLEAGSDGRNEPGIYIPGRKGSTIGTKYDWNLTSTPQPSLNNRIIPQTRGKVLGGSSALNLMTWDRAAKAEFDAWEELGNPGWNWDSIYSAMLKAENFFPSPEYGEDGVGYTGPIQTLINRTLPEHQRTWIPTMNALGIAENRESLNGYPMGVMRQPSNIRESNYTRSYSPEYLSLAGPNLILRLSTRVAKINFRNMTATGVTLEDGIVMTATKEVILSAGSLQSPQLLELSGVGRRGVLEKAGIEVVKELNGVGENLQDHIRIQNSYQLKPNYTSFDILRFNTTYAAEQLALWNEGKVSLYDYTGSGYIFMNWSSVSSNISDHLTSLANQNSSSLGPIEKLKISWLSEPYTETVPQLEVIFSDGYTGVKGYPPANSSLYGASFFTLIASIQHPLSSGSVHITSSNINTPPTINSNYLSHLYDLAAVKTATQYMRRIASTPPLSSVWVQEYEPGADVQSEEQWEDFARRTTLTIYHPVGTCAMMKEELGGAVDKELKTYGIKALRVVDASIIPVGIGAHIQTVVYGIAEKAAGMIIEEYR
ncbi:GMC oxidoreductase [Zopfia rhizophila CBS 207.26]|uniref:GMC oxidoreductase n=1 Tax=Zopfia rhizophila CBS 207.26 TaxID=1314779 RepID=A0A6A6DX41_9PEZI|nr:GMC oxidoreductase [Zopfia rhizophila CBS 207.26]